MNADRGEAAVQPAEIRRLSPADWDTYREVRLAALADAPGAFSSTLARELGFDEETWRQRIRSSAAFLGWSDGQPVGTAAGLADAGADPLAPPGSWQLVAMWVSPAARGAGVADLLVAAVAGAALEGGASTLVLWVTEINERARSFYQRLGFRPTGARGLVRPDEPGHWEVQLARDLR